MLLAGLGLGLVVGVGMVIGTIVGMNYARPALQFPETALHATSTHGGDNFAMATGLIADGMEGVFFLDYLTGDLQCFVINRRTTQIAGMFRQNVIAHLGAEQGKKPSYLMCTGLASFIQGSTNIRPADCVVYVADANTGRFAAYALPWNRNAIPSGQGQIAPLLLLGTGSARNLTIRE
jgi:hypothetical protein